LIKIFQEYRTENVKVNPWKEIVILRKLPKDLTEFMSVPFGLIQKLPKNQ